MGFNQQNVNIPDRCRVFGNDLTDIFHQIFSMILYSFFPKQDFSAICLVNRVRVVSKF